MLPPSHQPSHQLTPDLGDSQAREPVSVVTGWVQPRKPAQPTHRIMNEINDSYVKPLHFGVVCYTAKASWYKCQEKALFPPNKLPSCG